MRERGDEPLSKRSVVLERQPADDLGNHAGCNVCLGRLAIRQPSAPLATY
jgi:hypothetical protein